MNISNNRQKLKCALEKILTGDISFKEQIFLSDWLELKQALSPVNNHITHALTMLFIENINRYLDGISDEEKTELKRKYKNCNVNANGYDVVFEGKNVKFIAEVKANVRFEKKAFGSAQKKALKKDIGNLFQAKSKSKLNSTEDYFKFQVMLDYSNENFSTKEAITRFCNTEKTEIKILNEKLTDKSDKNKVYIVLLNENTDYFTNAGNAVIEITLPEKKNP